MGDTTQDADPPDGTVLSITVDRTGHDIVVTARGEIDLETSDELRATLSEIPTSAVVSVDLSDVAYMGSSGLRVLLRSREEFDDGGGRLRVTGASHPVARLIELAGVDDLFD